MKTVRTLSDRQGMGWASAVTHCVHGHPLSGDNLIVRAEGWRNCRQCMNEAARRYQARKARCNG